MESCRRESMFALPSSKLGSKSFIPSMSPRTSFAIGPIESKLGASGQTPSKETLPCVVLSPAIPQHAAGILIEPPVSEPNATSARSNATATADPLEEPPGTRFLPRGFTGVPYQGLIPVTPYASSCMLVRPTIWTCASLAP